MPAILKKLRLKKKPSVDKSISTVTKSFFRKSSREKRDDVCSIQPGITWTMTEDEHISSTSSPQSGLSVSAQNIVPRETNTSEPTMTFTEKEIMQNQLNHMRQLAEKDREIANYERVNQELHQKFDQTLTELEELHQVVLAEAEMKIAFAKSEVQEAKEKMVHMSATLMKTQAELFEATNRSNWSIWV